MSVYVILWSIKLLNIRMLISHILTLVSLDLFPFLERGYSSYIVWWILFAHVARSIYAVETGLYFSCITVSYSRSYWRVLL